MAATVHPPDTSLATLPVAYYGAQWDRDAANIAGLAKLQIVILMQEEGPCWTTCCPNASASADGKCNPRFNATSLPGCSPGCDQHGYQDAVFGRIKAAAAVAGARPPHCMIFANTIYDWPFMSTHALGKAVDVVATNGKPHMESCDPGIFPSFFFDYGRAAGRQAYLDIIERAVVNGSADGVYADCYGTFGLNCGEKGCRAQRNGKVQNYNSAVTAAQVSAYHEGKSATMHQAFELVGPNGSLFAKQSPIDGPALYGGNLMFIPLSVTNVSANLEQFATSRRFYKYLIVGGSNGYKHPTARGGIGPETAQCRETEIAMFLLAIEPGCFLLCQGYDNEWGGAKLGPATGPATESADGSWSRKFESGTTATFVGGVGKVMWATMAVVPT